MRLPILINGALVLGETLEQLERMTDAELRAFHFAHQHSYKGLAAAAQRELFKRNVTGALLTIAAEANQ
jgi:hypothetical protein